MLQCFCLRKATGGRDQYGHALHFLDFDKTFSTIGSAEPNIFTRPFSMPKKDVHNIFWGNTKGREINGYVGWVRTTLKMPLFWINR